jgi:uncharacterized membrane protein HdeD (DUF308 family)
MRPLVILGIVLMALGAFVLLFQGFTYFTTERVAQAGPFAIDVQKPHTIILNPIVGLEALACGVACVVGGSTSRRTTV